MNADQNSNATDNLSPQDQLHQQASAVKGAGLFLIAMAIASFFLPIIGIQFQHIVLLKKVLPSAPLWMAGLGLFLAVVASLRDPGPSDSSKK